MGVFASSLLILTRFRAWRRILDSYFSLFIWNYIKQGPSESIGFSVETSMGSPYTTIRMYVNRHIKDIQDAFNVFCLNPLEC